MKTLTAARVPAAPVLSPAEVVAHPHLEERQAFPEIEHPGRGKVRITAVPFQVDRRPGRHAAARRIASASTRARCSGRCSAIRGNESRSYSSWERSRASDRAR